MKRSELKVGADYLYSRSNDWRSYTGTRATVVSDLKVGTEKSFGFRSSKVRFRDPEGVEREVHADQYGSNAVIIRTPDRYTTTGVRYQAVPTAHLRGEWETANALVEANLKAEQERRHAERRAATDRSTRTMRAAERIEALGLGPQHLYVRGGDVAGISVDVIERLLDMAEREGGAR